MVLKTETLQELCSEILNAINPNELSCSTEVIDIQNDNPYMYFSVFTGEYIAQFKFKAECEENIHAVVNAELFLKLILKITTPTVELSIINDNILQIKGNGVYSLPLIFEDDALLKLPDITLNNVISTLKVKTSILKSIDKYNSIELNKGIFTNPVQKLYYVDDKGAATFTSGACINTFDIELPRKLLFNVRLVNLFKLFKDEMITISLSEDTSIPELTRINICIEDAHLVIKALLNVSANLINILPVDIARNLVAVKYPYAAEVNKVSFIQAIERIILFNTNLKHFNTVGFLNKKLRIYDCNDINYEDVDCTTFTELQEVYISKFDMQELLKVITSISGDTIHISFGNNKNIMITATPSVYFIIPECN